MAKFEYKMIEIELIRIFVPKLPEDLGAQVDRLAADGWELDKTVPILDGGFLTGSRTKKILLFFRREVDARNAPAANRDDKP